MTSDGDAPSKADGRHAHRPENFSIRPRKKCGSGRQTRGDPMRVVRSFAAAALFATLCAGPASAASTVTVSPTSGHPSQTVAGAGTGFGVNEAVDLYFDTTDTQLLVSSSTGTLNFSVPIPASATPGAHTVTAIGRESGDTAQGTVTVTTAWGEQGFGAAHLGWNPYENVLSTSNVSSLGTLWSVPASAVGGTPAVVNGRVFVGTNTGVMALSTTTGAVLWSKTFSQPFYGSPAVFANVVYIASLTGSVYALNASTGATIWTRVVDNLGFYSSPVIFNGIVYLGGEGKVFYALQASTGKTLWTYATSGAIDGSAAVANGMVYFGSRNDLIYALSATTGAMLWSYTTGGKVESTPAIANGILYIGSDDDKIYAISTADTNPGQLLWTYTTNGGVYAIPAVAGGVVYIGSADDNLYALSARSGALIWTNGFAGLVRTAAVANGVVYVTAQDGNAYAVSAAYASVLATAATGYTYFGGPAVADGRLFIASASGTVSAYALSAGADAVRARAPVPSSLRPDMSLRAKY